MEPEQPTATTDGMLSDMIRQIAPQFFTTDMPATLAYYAEYATRGVEFTRGPANTPWHARKSS